MLKKIIFDENCFRYYTKLLKHQFAFKVPLKVFHFTKYFAHIHQLFPLFERPPLVTSFCINRRKYWYQKNFSVPVLDGFIFLGMP